MTEQERKELIELLKRADTVEDGLPTLAKLLANDFGIEEAADWMNGIGKLAQDFGADGVETNLLRVMAARVTIAMLFLQLFKCARNRVKEVGDAEFQGACRGWLKLACYENMQDFMLAVCKIFKAM